MQGKELERRGFFAWTTFDSIVADWGEGVRISISHTYAGSSFLHLHLDKTVSYIGKLGQTTTQLLKIETTHTSWRCRGRRGRPSPLHGNSASNESESVRTQEIGTMRSHHQGGSSWDLGCRSSYKSVYYHWSFIIDHRIGPLLIIICYERAQENLGYRLVS